MRATPVMPRSLPRRGRAWQRAAPAMRRWKRRRRRPATGSPPPRDVEMQDPPRDEGALGVEVGALEVPAIEVVRTMEVLAIEVERTRARPTEGVRPPAAKVEAEEDETLGSHMVVCAKLTHEWVEVSPLPRSVF